MNLLGRNIYTKTDPTNYSLCDEIQYKRERGYFEGVITSISFRGVHVDGSAGKHIFVKWRDVIGKSEMSMKVDSAKDLIKITTGMETGATYLSNSFREVLRRIQPDKDLSQEELLSILKIAEETFIDQCQKSISKENLLGQGY